jgi:hypothetical protein
MLRKETISGALSDVLSRLMSMEVLANHRLVGGTALALQIGHRISIDIDLFSCEPSDYIVIEREIISEFKGEAQVLRYIQSPLGKGISLSILGVKTDILNWSKSFKFPIIHTEGIRLASLEEIALMKLDIITSPAEFARYEKKDFVDLSFLIEKFSLAGLIEVFSQQNPDFAFPERLILEALQSAELADKKPEPRMLKSVDWQSTKVTINEAVKSYLNPENPTKSPFQN